MFVGGDPLKGGGRIGVIYNSIFLRWVGYNGGMVEREKLEIESYDQLGEYHRVEIVERLRELYWREIAGDLVVAEVSELTGEAVVVVEKMKRVLGVLKEVGESRYSFKNDFGTSREGGDGKLGTLVWGDVGELNSEFVWDYQVWMEELGEEGKPDRDKGWRVRVGIYDGSWLAGWKKFDGDDRRERWYEETEGRWVEIDGESVERWKKGEKTVERVEEYYQDEVAVLARRVLEGKTGGEELDLEEDSFGEELLGLVILMQDVISAVGFRQARLESMVWEAGEGEGVYHLNCYKYFGESVKGLRLELIRYGLSEEIGSSAIWMINVNRDGVGWTLGARDGIGDNWFYRWFSDEGWKMDFTVNNNLGSESGKQIMETRAYLKQEGRVIELDQERWHEFVEWLFGDWNTEIVIGMDGTLSGYVIAEKLRRVLGVKPGLDDEAMIQEFVVIADRKRIEKARELAMWRMDPDGWWVECNQNGGGIDRVRLFVGREEWEASVDQGLPEAWVDESGVEVWSKDECRHARNINEGIWW